MSIVAQIKVTSKSDNFAEQVFGKEFIEYTANFFRNNPQEFEWLEQRIIANKRFHETRG